MILAAVHVTPALTVPLAIVVGVGMCIYWWSLRRPDVPPSRRVIRRVSVALMLISLPMFVRGLSFIDPAIQQREYVITWTMAMIMVALFSITALIDAVNNLRIHRRMRRDDVADAIKGLAQEIQTRRRSQPTAPFHSDDVHSSPHMSKGEPPA